MVDESMSVLAKKLEHLATSFPELQSETVVEVNVSLLYTCVRVESGCLYWWYVNQYHFHNQFHQFFLSPFESVVCP